MRLTSLLVAPLVLAFACDPGGSGAGGDDDDVIDAAISTVDAAVDGPGTVTPTFKHCTGRPFTPPPAGDFEHTASSIIAATGAPIHAGEDTIQNPGAPAHAIAHFMYGALNSGLDDEPVAVSIDDCTGWISLGTHATSRDADLDVPVTLALDPGVYEVRYAVVGDASVAVSYVWILPAGTHVAVSDIDGTLTTSDTELFLQILNGSYVPAAYPSATTLTTTHAGKGHIVVYATGRPMYLTTKTREWLSSLGFAPGPLRLAPSTADALPFDTGVGAYKKSFLESLTAQGLVIDLAYGNATTDIFAYTGAGVPATKQWIIGTNAGTSGTNAVMDSWAARVTEVQALPAVTQPFAF